MNDLHSDSESFRCWFGRSRQSGNFQSSGPQALLYAQP